MFFKEQEKAVEKEQQALASNHGHDSHLFARNIQTNPERKK